MPGFGIPKVSGTFQTYDADLENKQFRAVKFTSERVVDFCTAATDKVIGILNNVPYGAAGKDAEVIMFGEAKAKLAGDVTAGNHLVSDANGDLVAVTPVNTGTLNWSVGIALEDGADNDIKRVFVNPCWVLVA